MPRSKPQATPASNLDDSLGFLLAETARATRRLLYGHLVNLGIRGGSWHVLRVLWEGDGLTQRELADRLGMTQPSTLEMLRAMEKDGHVFFQRDPQDRRKNRVFLTKEAQALKAPLLCLAEGHMEEIVQQMTDAEAALLKRLLRMVRDASLAKIASAQAAQTVELDLKEETKAAGASTNRRFVASRAGQ